MWNMRWAAGRQAALAVFVFVSDGGSRFNVQCSCRVAYRYITIANTRQSSCFHRTFLVSK